MSEIITNKLTGKTAVGSLTITAENDSSGYTLQQTIAKVTGNLQSDATSNSAVSMNISSVVDTAASQNTVNVTNIFSARRSAATLISNHDNSYNRGHSVDDTSASSFLTRSFTCSGGALSGDAVAHSIAFFGELA